MTLPKRKRTRAKQVSHGKRPIYQLPSLYKSKRSAQMLLPASNAIAVETETEVEMEEEDEMGEESYFEQELNDATETEVEMEEEDEIEEESYFEQELNDATETEVETEEEEVLALPITPDSMIDIKKEIIELLERKRFKAYLLQSRSSPKAELNAANSVSRIASYLLFIMVKLRGASNCSPLKTFKCFKKMFKKQHNLLHEYCEHLENKGYKATTIQVHLAGISKFNQ